MSVRSLPGLRVPELDGESIDLSEELPCRAACYFCSFRDLDGNKLYAFCMG